MRTRPVISFRHRRYGLLLSLLGLLLTGCSSAEAPLEPAALLTRSYRASTADFLNPERGFHTDADLLSETDLSWVRAEGSSLVRAYIRLDAFRDRPLSDAFLADLRKGLARLRPAGVKLIPRFTYNFPEGDYEEAPDAPLPVALGHIAQLRPLLRRYADVIAVFPAGFVGAWGEWHSSGNDLDTLAAKRQILAALLGALPESRSVQLRYPGDLAALYPEPLPAAEAYTGTDRARTGHHNDCFLANATDAGTYYPEEQGDAYRRYLEALARFAPVGGETCQVTPAEARTDCLTAVTEMRRFRWGYLNANFYRPVIDRWRREGCFGEISKRLGYRYRLVRSQLPATARPGGLLPVRLSVANDGWARPYNPRRLELVLRNRRTGAATHVRLSTGQDLRLRLPGPASTTVLTARPKLPAGLPRGTYDLLLNLPDPARTLYGNPAYSIRLANEGVWEAKTGFNDLLASVRVQ